MPVYAVTFIGPESLASLRRSVLPDALNPQNGSVPFQLKIAVERSKAGSSSSSGSIISIAGSSSTTSSEASCETSSISSAINSSSSAVISADTSFSMVVHDCTLGSTTCDPHDTNAIIIAIDNNIYKFFINIFLII